MSRMQYVEKRFHRTSQAMIVQANDIIAEYRADRLTPVRPIMTRINVGIPPAELCDQHLLAEIRELPRAIGVEIKTPPPEFFKLGAGHVSWCAQYQGSLDHRFDSLLREAEHRGFNVSGQTKRDPLNDKYWTYVEEKMWAIPALRHRIRERLNTMKRTPKWTNRERPEWTM